MSSFLSERILNFHLQWRFQGLLPEGFSVLEPLDTRPETRKAMETFYHTFYKDDRPRVMLIGINPSRHGAGVTGVPFTDTKQLYRATGFQMQGLKTHELSSVFIYDVIDAYGGPQAFFGDFYIHSPFPQAIVRRNKKGNWVNATYYETKQVLNALYPSLLSTMDAQVAMGMDTNNAMVLGRKNGQYLSHMNAQKRWFKQLHLVDHPRFIQQYRPRDRESYIAAYLDVLRYMKAEMRQNIHL
jgi:hypothetical protein